MSCMSLSIQFIQPANSNLKHIMLVNTFFFFSSTSNEERKGHAQSKREREREDRSRRWHSSKLVVCMRKCGTSTKTTARLHMHSTVYRECRDTDDVYQHLVGREQIRSHGEWQNSLWQLVVTERKSNSDRKK